MLRRLRDIVLERWMIQRFERVGTDNPLVLDEVDKTGPGINRDPANALLGMLDPEQRNGFLGH
ncbi:hypothetical protein BDN72DRAFT_384767 [Pluteus cervinus]|uniref:Uncharacterized protein n=1 Tax=Pluteus cervinus TaxID=181527 RepID=A0ACD3AAA3_9AGAR|nr:hypothetical protein BDN72DRAFT_384767 [Pluteus cervinus]